MMLYNFKFGAVFYRDPIDSKGDINDYYNLTSDTTSLQSFVSRFCWITNITSMNNNF